MTTTNDLRALLVYESMFGNTEKAAQAVSEGLRLEGLQVTVAEVREAPKPDAFDLLVLGAPTHAFSLSRASTRANAVEQGAPARVATTGMREWLDALEATEGARLAAAFDTRARKVKHLPAAASRKAARLVSRKGYDLVVPPQGFLVEDTAGPLSEGQLEEATAWGRAVATASRHKLAAASLR